MEASDHQRRAFAVHLSRRRALGTGIGTSAVALLAACGRKTTGRSGASTSSQTSQPRSGGTFSAAQGSDPFDFDPSHKPQENGYILSLAHDGLLNSKTGAGVPFGDVVIGSGIAERWESPDAQTFTFHLRQGATFANLPPVNGRAVTSADVQWSQEYMSRTGRFKDTKLPPSLSASMYEGLDRIETPDASTLVVHFRAPFVPFLSDMAMREWNPILAHEIFDQDGSFSNRIAGTGPWQLDTSASQKGSRWVMKKNSSYFQKGQPYLDEVDYLILTDEATQRAAFQTKQIDLLSHEFVTVQSLPQIRKDNPAATEIQFDSTAGGHLFENVRKAPLEDARIRKAIALCIDRDEFIRVFSGGQGDWALAGGVPGLFTQEETKKLVQLDPAQAKQLVSDAGFPSGVDLELIYPGLDRGQQYVSTIQLIQAQLKKGNINVNLKSLDRATQGNRLKSGDYELEWETKTVLGDPDSYIFYTFYSTAAGNYGGIDDPALDKLLLAQRQEVDASKRKDILRQAVQRIAGQAWSVAFYYGKAYDFTQSYVKNYAPSAILNAPPVYETWLEK